MEKKEIITNPESNIEKVLTIRVDKEKREKTFSDLMREISICHGTGKEGDCDMLHIDKEVKPDGRLANFIINQFDGYSIVITSGYRCPKHNEYSAKNDQSGMTKPDSLHTRGQAVDFYLLGPDGKPLDSHTYQEIIKKINNEYQFSPMDWQKIYANSGNQNYLSKENPNMVFIKYYNPDEGRDPDNQHPYNYMHLDFRTISSDDPVAKPYYDKLTQ